MDDKTAKIPSLKEFEKSHKQNPPRKNSRKAKPADKKSGSIKADTHRVELDRAKSKSSHYPAADRNRARSQERSSYKRGNVSGDTRKIDSEKLRENSYNNRRQEDVKTYERRKSPSQQGLTQTRVAGRRPQGQAASQSENARHRAYSEERACRDAQRNGNSSQRRNDPHRGTADRSGGHNTRRKRKKPKKPLSPFARKARRVLIYSLIVLAVLVAGIILSMTVLFKTENIVVNIPDNFYSSQDIISASGLHYQDNIFTAGKNQASKRLMEKFPYIKEADVYAVMPDTINIDITLCTESYAVKTDNITYIAGEDSKVLKVTSTADEVQVPLVEGVEVKSARVGEKLEFESEFVRESLSEMFEYAKLMGYKKITAVDIETSNTASGTQTIEIRYVYDSRIVVYLGLPENISYKMQTAQTIISDKLDVNGALLTGELDVSQCYDTNKSYFNQYSLIPDVVVTEPASTASEPSEDSEDYGYYE